MEHSVDAGKRSSNLHFARYANGKLFVDFKNKEGVKVSTYSYDGTLLEGGQNPAGVFPTDLYEAFALDPEPGKFFARVIRFKYKGVKQ